MNRRTHLFIDLSLLYLNIALVLDLRIRCVTIKTICRVDDSIREISS